MVILSDNGTQFQSPLWKRSMSECDIMLLDTPRATQVNGA
jgi:hypothetical protein